MAGKAGRRRAKAFEGYVAHEVPGSLLNFGEMYNALPKGNAAVGNELVKNANLIERMLITQGSGRFLTRSLKEVLIQVVEQCPRVNRSDRPAKQFAQWACAQALALLWHIRRLNSQPARLKECRSKMEAANTGKLEYLLSLMASRGRPISEKSGDAHKRRRLRRHLSCEDGLPRKQVNCSDEGGHGDEEIEGAEEETRPRKKL